MNLEFNLKNLLYDKFVTSLLSFSFETFKQTWSSLLDEYSSKILLEVDSSRFLLYVESLRKWLVEISFSFIILKILHIFFLMKFLHFSDDEYL